MAPINLSEIQAKLASRPKSGGNFERSEFKWYRLPREGEAKIIFLPPTGGSSVPGMIQWTHWSVPELGHLTCLRTFDKVCPYCEYLKEIQNKTSEELLKQYQSSSRAVHNVLVLGDRNIPQNESHILTSGEYTYWWLLEQILNQEVGDITDPRAAHSVIFKRVTPGGRFERVISLKAMPIADSEEGIKKILDSAADLQNIWKYSEDLEQKLEKGGKLAVEDILSKTEAMSNPVTSVPSPSPIPSIPVNAQPNPASFVNQTPQAPVQQSPVQTTSPSEMGNPLDHPECFGKYPGEGNDKCSLCFSEIECGQATNKQ